MTDPTKAKIIELLPELEKRISNGDVWQENITLADVLRAIEVAGIGIRIDENGTFWRTIANECFRDETGASIWWQLEKDYDGQTQEVKDFIGKLLGV